jgi:hypothetical protein
MCVKNLEDEKMKTWSRLAALTLVAILLTTLLAGCGTPATPITVEKTVEVEKVVEVEKTVEVEVVKEVLVTPTPEPMAEGAKMILRVGTGDSGEGLAPHSEISSPLSRRDPDILVQLELSPGRIITPAC